MKKTFFVILTVITTLIFSGAALAEITTVILSENTDPTFTVSAENEPNETGALTFEIGLVQLPPDAKVVKCRLRVVPMPQPTLPCADQDVTVFAGDEQVGQWSTFSQTTGPYVVELMPKVCTPGSNAFTLELKTESKYTKWEYYGGDTADTWNQPRLIVTYDSPSRPTPARSGHSTDWAYEKPASFFSSPLLELTNSKELLANPVFYADAVYVVVGSSDTRGLYRLAGSEKNLYWPLDFEVDKGSFAFVTAWGHLQLITKNAIHSCDLTTLATRGSADKSVWDATKAGEKITVNALETPAMGPDGSLYFKNVETQGRIVAYNPSLREIWRTELKLTAVSPIVLSANGHYAYLLAEIEQENKVKMTALLRIDTATGETTQPKEITCEKRPLQELLRPAVTSKVINDRVVDYVFVAGNTSGKGILQLVFFHQSASPCVPWTREGKHATEPVLGVKDGSSLFAVQGCMLKCYIWYNTKEDAPGPYLESDLEEETLKEGISAGKIALLVDGSDSVYMREANLLYAYQSTSKTTSPGQKLEFNPTELLFTPDGALIGYDNSKVYDLSPKALVEEISPKTLATGTIYSADSITLPADAVIDVKNGKQVILKGYSIKSSKGFRWPAGVTLKCRTCRRASNGRNERRNITRPIRTDTH